MASDGFANTPADGFLAVIFTSQHGAATDGYGEMAERMLELAAEARRTQGGPTPRYTGLV